MSSEMSLREAAPQSQRALRLSQGQIEYLWDVGLSEAVVCHLSYEPAERGAREHGTGLQLEPDHPASVTLEGAYLRGLDIYMMLSEVQIEDVETNALLQLEDEKWAI